MLKLRITTAMEFRQMIATISTISNTTHIEFSENFTLFHTTHKTTNVLSLLHLSSKFFHHYHISRPFIVNAKLAPINDFLGDIAADDDAVYIVIYSEDKFPITYLDFQIHNSRNEIKIMTLEVTELHAEPFNYEPIHEFRVAISSNLLKEIAMNSAHFKTAILVSVTSTCLRLSSGSETIVKHTKQEIVEFKIENAPKSMMYELRLPCSFAKSIILASCIANVVNIRDSYSRIKDPTMLEFLFGRYSRLLFYLRNPLVLQ